MLLVFIQISCRQNSNKQAPKIITPVDSLNSFDLADTTALVDELIVYKRTSASLLGNLPQYLTKFISKGYAALDTVSADLNTDGITDFLLALYKIGEDTINPSPKRNLKLLLGQPDQTYKLECQSWTVLAPLDMGGFSDPFPGIIASKGKFVIQFSGGSNWKDTEATTFEYSDNAEDWIQTKRITESYFMNKRQYESDTLTKKQFGHRTFKRNYCK